MEPGREPTGTIVFASVGVTSFGFDVFSVAAPQTPESASAEGLAERRHTDGVSINFNAQFADEGGEEVAFVSERTGSAGLFLCRPGSDRAVPLPAVEGSLFHDRPTVRGGRLYFVSAHEKPDGWFRSWAAVYATDLGSEETVRVTPRGVADMSPAVSVSGELLAVASYGERPWAFDFHELETEQFTSVTSLLNPELHHYNPFFSPSGARLGYHRFRGAGAPGDSLIPYRQPVRSPVSSVRMLRVHGSFPSFSPDAKYLALNGDFFKSPGVTILRADGSKRWVLAKQPNLFYTSWSPSESGVVFTSAGPIFETPKATVRVARIEFDPTELTDDRGDVDVAVKELTRPEAGNDAFPAVSPCGRWLVFRSGRSGHKNLYIVDAARGEETIRRVTDGEWIDTMPSWSPDGELIAFSSNRHEPGNAAVFSIYLVRPDGTGLRRVHVAGPPGSAEADRERINHVCFSPDGEWLLFTANLGGVVAEPVSGPNQFQPYGDLYVCRLDGSGVRRLTCNAYENGTPTWGPALGVESLSLGAPAADDSLGEFDEPLWLTCGV
ncbi:unnamed protein product [Triticum turgidum subsp. durum]|uniref:Uncharacterized protein n=1 Tax=Triticum turgidum subsp. durum TaxID=4567 RepID=A0A9R1NM35_TRITD|nr:unnamed protein product [Triticum turgidum subsp. durum]